MKELKADFESDNSDKYADSDDDDADREKQEKQFDQEAFDLFLTCIQVSEKLKRIRLNHAKLTSSQTSQVIRAILDSESVKTIKDLDLDGSSNFSLNESVQLMVKLIDRAKKFTDLDIRD